MAPSQRLALALGAVAVLCVGAGVVAWNLQHFSRGTVDGGVTVLLASFLLPGVAVSLVVDTVLLAVKPRRIAAIEHVLLGVFGVFVLIAISMALVGLIPSVSSDWAGLAFISVVGWFFIPLPALAATIVIAVHNSRMPRLDRASVATPAA